MTIIKEIRLPCVMPTTNQRPEYFKAGRCVVRTGGYGCSLLFIQNLFKVAQEDFPWLTEAHVEIVHFGGKQYARTFGIEFDSPNELATPPDGWTEIPELEFTL
jgi:hypothetical protein